MTERNLRTISTLSEAERLATVSEGLSKIAESVSVFERDLSHLTTEDAVRSHRVISGVIEEECAKYLILLDYIRYPDEMDQLRSKHLAYFYDHFVRVLYSTFYTDIRPATFREVGYWVDRERPAYYLDGPMGVDWIYRNRFIDERERGLYVDYIEADGDCRWISPADLDAIHLGYDQYAPRVLQFVQDLELLMLSTPAALGAIRKVWRPVKLHAAIHWQEVLSLNRATVAAARKANGVLSTSKKPEVVDRVINAWTFPLAGIDLRQEPDNRSELKEVQADWHP